MVAAGGYVAKAHQVVSRPLQFSAGEYARRIATRQSGRVVGLGAATGILARDLGEIELALSPQRRSVPDDSMRVGIVVDFGLSPYGAE